MTENEFEKRNKEHIENMSSDDSFKTLTRSWFRASEKHEYSYHFSWLGRPIIQYPQDIIAVQEIIWNVKPDLIIETGIAHGGSLIFSASMLELIGHGEVLGIDVDIREHNRMKIEDHPMYKRIKMIQGSSINDEIVKKVYEISKGKNRVLVFLDSNHTHDHVLSEMNLYSPLVHKDSYMIVFDTIIEDIAESTSSPSNNKRPWGRGNNPKTAVKEFLKTNDRFEIDKEIENKLLITVAPSGYLRCVKD
ncbi:MAG: cephalosporin hydroxylase family protein [Nitrosotalea sp.]